MKTHPNQEQAALWNGTAGDAWVAQQALLDAMFARFERMLVEVVQVTGANRVLDVGCGAGATTLAVAGQIGAAGSCTGIDISAPLIELARARAARAGATVEFRLADAQTYEFAGPAFDLVISRFGVMFFDDPVAAFANLRGAVRRGGALRVIAFRPPQENPFMTVAERAAASLLPDLPARRPDAPGQFGLANPARVREILAAAGWSAIDLAPIDVPCAFPAHDLAGYVSRLGPVGQALRGVDAALRNRIIERVSEAFLPFVHGAEIRFDAACWMIGAESPA